MRGSASGADPFVWAIFPPIIVPFLVKGTGAMTFFDALLILVLTMAGWIWVLRRKHRSLAWLLLTGLLPLGWIPIIYLNEGNK